jgi:hypothetical protein
MVSPYESAGVDFDALFDPYVTGTFAPLTHRRIGGIDLNQRYAPIEFGTKGPDVGYRVAGVDISNFFAAAGTASYVSSTAGLPTNVEVYQNSTSGPVTAVAGFLLFRNGDTQWDVGNVGEWFPGGGATIGDAYDVEFVLISGGVGTLSGSPLNTRLQLNAPRGVSSSVTRTTSGATRGNRQIRVQIFRRSDSAIVATQFVLLEPEADIS